MLITSYLFPLTLSSFPCIFTVTLPSSDQSVVHIPFIDILLPYRSFPPPLLLPPAHYLPSPHMSLSLASLPLPVTHHPLVPFTLQHVPFLSIYLPRQHLPLSSSPSLPSLSPPLRCLPPCLLLYIHLGALNSQ